MAAQSLLGQFFCNDVKYRFNFCYERRLTVPVSHIPHGHDPHSLCAIGKRSEHTLHCVSIRVGLKGFLRCLESFPPVGVQQKES